VHESTLIAENLTVKPPVALAVVQCAVEPGSDTATRMRSREAKPTPFTVKGDASATVKCGALAIEVAGSINAAMTPNGSRKRMPLLCHMHQSSKPRQFQLDRRPLKGG